MHQETNVVTEIVYLSTSLDIGNTRGKKKQKKFLSLGAYIISW